MIDGNGVAPAGLLVGLLALLVLGPAVSVLGRDLHRLVIRQTDRPQATQESVAGDVLRYVEEEDKGDGGVVYLLEVSQAVFELTERQAGATPPVVRLGCEKKKKKKKRCKPTSLTTGTPMKPNHKASKRRT